MINHRVGTCRKSLFVVLVVAAMAGAQPTSGPQPSPAGEAKPQTFEERLNLHEVTPQIVCGAIPQDADIAKLAQDKKVTRVISLLDPAEVPPTEVGAIEAAGLSYHHLPIQIPGAAPTDTHLDTAMVRKAVEMLSTGGEGVTFLHCKTGTNRVQAVNIAYRVLVENQTYAAAVRQALLEGFRPDERPNFLGDLKKLIAGVEELPVLEGQPIADRDLNGPGELLNIGGQKINVKKSGEGPPVIVIHGGPGETHKPLRPYLDALAKQCTLVYYDQRGCGLSSKPQFAEAYTLDRLVKELDGLRDALGFEKISLIAHSSGNVIAVKYALAHRDRVNKLVLVSGWASGEEFGKYGSMSLALLNAQDRKAYGDHVQRLRNEGRRSFNDGEIAQLTQLLYPTDYFNALSPAFKADWNRRTEVSAMANDAQTKELLQQVDLRPQLPSLTDLPTLVIAGRFDVVVPPDVVKTYADGIPGARFEVFPYSGHYSFVEENERWLELVGKFLGE